MKMVSMKVGDLVRVAPSRKGIYLVTSLEAIDSIGRTMLGCVMLASQSEPGPPSPMNKKWIEVISEAS